MWWGEGARSRSRSRPPTPRVSEIPSPAPPAPRTRAASGLPPSGAPPAPSVALRRGEIEDDRTTRSRGERIILIVEDDAPFAQILLDLAHARDFDGVVATSSREGLELARTLHPAAVILDVGLPDESGLVFLERLKRDPTLRHMPVHVASVHDYSQTALELGAVGYALKPVKREELLAALAKLETKLAQRVRRLLIVEDDARLRESIIALLAHRRRRDDGGRHHPAIRWSTSSRRRSTA